ncbi:G-box-binding factor 3-like isoform X2 [Aristolochia californica]|uniref:G-box-binding factor 3-like isoform X2 n=1 Tax=Aristolochia californica TaxID=171875 RepID=UPI0035E1162E
MGNGEAETSSKMEKTPSPVQANFHGYPDWASIQAYYGPGLGLPPPYFGSPIAPGHPPHPYLWGPQHIMPPYGSPYAAVYPHGVYGQPSIAVGPHPHAPGITSSAATTEHMTFPLSVEKPAKSGNKDRGLMKKLKSFDGIAVYVSTRYAENASGGATRASPSGECELEGSSDGGSSQEGSDSKGKRSPEGMPVKENFGNSEIQANTCHGEEKKTKGTKGTTSVPPRAVIPACHGLPSECWDDRELKREKRKQSNRESARRSRLRKQAESEQLAMKVDMLSAENLTLRSEINRLTESAQKLSQENSHLLEKLKNAEQGEGDTGPERIEQENPPVNNENFLSGVSSTSLISSSSPRDSETRDNSGKLHQLFDSNPRADAVAAG